MERLRPPVTHRAHDLGVDVFVRDSDGGWRVLDVPERCDDSAGSESGRRTVWGSGTVRSLGARHLPVLAGSDLLVEAPEVPDVLREVAPLQADLDLIATTTERPRGITERQDRMEFTAAHHRGDGPARPGKRRRPSDSVGQQTAAPARAVAEPGRRRVTGRGAAGTLALLPECAGRAQPISSSALPFVSLTNFRTNGMESAANAV